MIYLPDTNTVSYFFKGLGNVSNKWFATSPDEVFLSSLVVYELRTGARKANYGTVRLQQLETFISNHHHVVFGVVEADIAADLRVQLEKLGTPIGPIDLLIAATALTHNATLVTHNQREFQRVPGLVIEDWY